MPSRRSCRWSSAASGVSLRGAGNRLLRARHADAARARWCSRCTRSRSLTMVRHLDGSPWFEDYLRELAARAAAGRLGDLRGRHRRRHGPLDRGRDAGRRTAACHFEKQAPTVSYGAHADDLFVTLRRARRRGAERPGDRARPEPARRARADGQPGTRSACGAPAPRASSCARALRSEQVLAAPVLAGHAQSRWCRSPTCCGRTCGSASRPTPSTAPAPSCGARRSAPQASRPPSAQRLSHLMSELSLLRAEVNSGAARTSWRRQRSPGASACARWPRRCASTTSRSPPPSRRPASARARSGCAGSMGFKNDTPFSVGRHLRDTMSACLMVANERIHETEREPAADRQGGLMADVPPGDRRSGGVPRRAARRAGC